MNDQDKEVKKIERSAEHAATVDNIGGSISYFCSGFMTTFLGKIVCYYFIIEILVIIGTIVYDLKMENTFSIARFMANEFSLITPSNAVVVAIFVTLVRTFGLPKGLISSVILIGLIPYFSTKFEIVNKVYNIVTLQVFEPTIMLFIILNIVMLVIGIAWNYLYTEFIDL